MATISTRVDDNTKSEAELVANGIGITLSTAINVFLKQFIANNGFPFEVVAPKKETKTVINLSELNAAVKKAISNPDNPKEPDSFTYIDPKTNQQKIISFKE
jgi:DNA-damage-inducible protein J